MTEALYEFWRETWGWFLYAFLAVWALWFLSLAIVATVPLTPTNRYKLSRLERVLAWLPSWSRVLAGESLPSRADAGPAFSRLHRQYFRGLQVADRAHRTLLVVPLTLSYLGIVIAVAQGLDTLLGLTRFFPNIYSWNGSRSPCSSGASASSFSPSGYATISGRGGFRSSGHIWMVLHGP
jgi:hypothetical protein